MEFEKAIVAEAWTPSEAITCCWPIHSHDGSDGPGKGEAITGAGLTLGDRSAVSPAT